MSYIHDQIKLLLLDTNTIARNMRWQSVKVLRIEGTGHRDISSEYSIKYSFQTKLFDPTSIVDAEFTLNKGMFVTAKLKLSDVKAISDFIQSFALNAYTDAFNHDAWRKVYRIDTYDFPKVVGWDYGKETTLGGPCHYCGYVVPRHLLTVDHKMPQSGGTFAAVSKVLGGCPGYSLTLKDAHGTKGVFAKHGQLQWAKTHGVAFSAADKDFKISDSFRKERYTLNDQGALFYSLAHYAAKLHLFDACMNSVLNLAPVCSSCNSVKKNWV
ncbi:MAG: hypothetical protein KF796_14425 [Ramlibacter sp.]|nr:hypothetical protein [Ramlibacter sp.]